MRGKFTHIILWVIAMGCFLSPFLFYWLSLNSKKVTPIILKTQYPQGNNFSKQPLSTIRVHVSGAIQNPGVYTITLGSTLLDILHHCELLPNANISKLNLAKVLRDEQKIFIHSIEPASLININMASIKELTSLPGIGRQTAKHIVEYRNSYGGIHTENDLLKVKGLSKKKIKKLRSYVLF